MKNLRKISTLLLIVFIVVFLLPVNTSASTIKLNKTKATLEIGKTTTLKVNGTKKAVKWSSSNKKVATVTKNGKVKGISEGKATITATVSSKTYKATITVKDETVELILSAILTGDMTVEEFIDGLDKDKKAYTYKKYDDTHYSLFMPKSEYDKTKKTDWFEESINEMKMNEAAIGVITDIEASKDYKTFKIYVDESKYDFSHAIYILIQTGVLADYAQAFNQIKPEDRSIDISIINNQTKKIIYSN